MKVIVKDEKCIGCGSCVSLTNAEIFDFDEETGKAYAKNSEIKNEDEEMVKTAMEYCPTEAIVDAKEDEEVVDSKEAE